MPQEPTSIQKALAAVAAQQERQGCLAGLLGGFFGGTPPAPVGTPSVHLIATPGTIIAPGPLILTLEAANVTRLRLLIDGIEQTEPQSAGQLVRQILAGTTNKAYTYRLEGRDAAGALLAFHETTVTVDLAPVAPPDPAAPTVTVSSSSGGTVTLALGNLQSGDQLNWGDGVTVAAAPSLTHTYSASGTLTAQVKRGGLVAAFVTFTVTLPPPVGGLSNDGDAFTWAYQPYTGSGTITSYRTYSMRSAGAISRVLIAETATAQPVIDNTVEDGGTAWYKTYMVVGGTEVLVDSAMDTQPARTGWISDQLVISAPGTYTLRHKNPDRTRAAVRVLDNVTGVFINGLLASKGDGIQVGQDAEVTVNGLRAWGLHPGVANAGHGYLIAAQNAAKIIVEHNFGENWWFMVYALGNDTTKLNTFRVRYNRFRNCEGRRTTLDAYVTAGELRAFPIAHFIQLNGCQAIADAEIAWNELIQEPGQGFVEDPINIYASSCVTGNRGRIHDNACYGGNTAGNIETDTYAGVGIIFDGDSIKTRFWNVYKNTCTTSNGGVSVAHGSDIDIYDNDCYCAGVLEDGRKIWGVNVGVAAFNYVSSDPIKRIRVYGNRSRYFRPPGTSQDPNSARAGEYGGYYLAADGVDGNEMAYSANTELPLVQDPAARIQTERGYYRSWLASVSAAGLTVGAA